LTPSFRKIQEIRKDFINFRVTQSFQGYAKAQMKKGVHKAQSFNDLIEFKRVLEVLVKDKGNSLLAEAYHLLDAFDAKDKALWDKINKKEFIQVNNLTFKKSINISWP